MNVIAEGAHLNGQDVAEAALLKMRDDIGDHDPKSGQAVLRLYSTAAGYHSHLQTTQRRTQGITCTYQASQQAQGRVIYHDCLRSTELFEKSRSSSTLTPRKAGASASSLSSHRRTLMKL
jgi:hypothetical protein